MSVQVPIPFTLVEHRVPDHAIRLKLLQDFYAELNRDLASNAIRKTPNPLLLRTGRQRRARAVVILARRRTTRSGTQHGHRIPRLRSDVARSIIQQMNTAAKLLRAMRTNPLNWQLAQLQTVARQNGIDWRHEGTSHCVFVRNDGKTLPVPARRPIKPIYVKKFLELVEGA